MTNRIHWCILIYQQYFGLSASYTGYKHTPSPTNEAPYNPSFILLRLISALLLSASLCRLSVKTQQKSTCHQAATNCRFF